MRFRLRTLLGLITVACILLAIGLSVANHRQKVRQHNQAFRQLDDDVSALDDELRFKILRIPTVVAQLQEANSIDPPMALSHSIDGASMRFGTPQFARTFHYNWQVSNGWMNDGIKVTANATFNDASLDDHIVYLTYETNALNDEVAAWIAEQLDGKPYVQVKHVKLQTASQDHDARQTGLEPH